MDTETENQLKDTDLRLGNWVYTKSHTPGRDSTTPVKMDTRHLNMMGAAKEYYPIPLTPELLEKAGFQPAGEGTYYTGKNEWQSDFTGVEPVSNGEGYYRINEEYTAIGKPFHYLHQLQNLFHALTGEELEINL